MCDLNHLSLDLISVKYDLCLEIRDHNVVNLFVIFIMQWYIRLAKCDIILAICDLSLETYFVSL